MPRKGTTMADFTISPPPGMNAEGEQTIQAGQAYTVQPSGMPNGKNYWLGITRPVGQPFPPPQNGEFSGNGAFVLTPPTGYGTDTTYQIYLDDNRSMGDASGGEVQKLYRLVP